MYHEICLVMGFWYQNQKPKVNSFSFINRFWYFCNRALGNLAGPIWFFDPRNTKPNLPKNQICESQKPKITSQKTKFGDPQNQTRGAQNTKPTWFVEGRTSPKRIAANTGRSGPKSKENVSCKRNALGFLGAQEDLLH